MKESPIIAFKYDFARMNFLDVEKKAFLFQEFVYAEKYGCKNKTKQAEFSSD